MTDAERIIDLERRLADAEARIARLESAADPYPWLRPPVGAPLPKPVVYRECFCPPCAEYTCQSVDCPRRIPVTCGGAS